jgi:hypothetical protein
MTIYREIRIDYEGLFSLSHNSSQKDIKDVIGVYFPQTNLCD